MANPAISSPWLAAHASVIGRGHISRNLPCQDSHTWYVLPEQPAWGVAVVSDGAGSCAHSDKGSARVAQTASQLFANLLRAQDWATTATLPTAADWTVLARQTLRAVADDLRAYAQSLNLELRDLSATVIVVVFGPLGLLVAHIGDGRAAGQLPNGQWQALLEPYRGEEANVTVFITSSIWAPEKIASYVGATVFPYPFRAFALLSDGCEMATFLLSVRNEETQQFDALNQPYAPFFDPNVAALLRLHQQGKTTTQINSLWAKLLTDGVQRLADETDDKTLILAVNLGLAAEAEEIETATITQPETMAVRSVAPPKSAAKAPPRPIQVKRKKHGSRRR